MSPTVPQGSLHLGDNLRVMADLLPDFAGRCRLALVDPPYNARNRKDYPDEMRRDEWLAWLEERLRLACQFLSPNGILACHIDDSEQAYLHVLLDRLLGRDRHLNTVCVKMSELSGVKMRYQDRMLPRTKEFLLLYGATEAARLKPLRRAKDSDKLSGYADYYRWFLENPDDPVEAWRVRPVREVLKERGLPATRAALDGFRLAHSRQMVYRTNNRWFDTLPSEQRPTTTFARRESPWEESYVWWEGKQMLFLSDHLDEPLGDIWTDISTINLGREGGVSLRSGKKPEALVERIVELCTDPGDWILDPFCGSGTTPAVAQRTGRNWISIEIDPGIADRARTRLDAAHGDQVPLEGGENGPVAPLDVSHL
jgi:adenine-specific DNA-methyltransferase